MTTSFNAGQTFKAANVPAPYVTDQNASADTTVSGTTLTDLTGATLTVTTRTAAATVEIVGTFDMQVVTTGTAIATGHCNVDGVDQPRQATASMTTTGQRGTNSQTWKATLSGTGAHVIKLQGMLSAASGSMTFKSTHTSLSVTVFDF